MSRRNLFPWVAGTAAISSLLTYLSGAALTSSPDISRCESSAATGNLATVTRKFSERTDAVETGTLELGAAKISPRRAMQPDDGRRSVADAARAADAYRKRLELSGQFSNLFNTGGSRPGDVNAKVESRFYLEEWNQEWADDKERGIRSLFSADEALRGMDPLQVSCRSKNCQVVVAVSSRDEVRQLSQKFMQAASRADVGMKDQVVSFFPDTSTGRLVFYLSEGGNTDLFQ